MSQRNQTNVTTPIDEVFGGSDDDGDSLLDTESVTGRLSATRDPFIDDEVSRIIVYSITEDALLLFCSSRVH